jgi:hypothetical protein
MRRWLIGESVIEGLIGEGALQELIGDAAQGGPWLTKAATTLSSARRLVAEDPASAYVLAYDAARQACVGVLAQQGLRATTSGGHYAVDRAVTAQFQGAFHVFGSLRRRRNRIEYPTQPDEVGAVGPDEAAEAIDAVATIVDKATELLPNLGLFSAK